MKKRSDTDKEATQARRIQTLQAMLALAEEEKAVLGAQLMAARTENGRQTNAQNNAKKMIKELQEEAENNAAAMKKLVIQNANMVKKGEDVIVEAANHCRAELKDKSKAQGMELNSENFMVMGGYSHCTFLETIQNRYPSFMLLMLGVFGCSLAVAVPAAPAPDATADAAVVLEDGMRLSHWLSLCVASALTPVVDNFTWEFASILEYAVRSLTRSPTTINMIGFSLPGGCSCFLDCEISTTRSNQLGPKQTEPSRWQRS